MKGHSDLNVHQRTLISQTVQRSVEPDGHLRSSDSDQEGSETPFVGNHGVKVVRNLKRLR
jgi:hypothetical protein